MGTHTYGNIYINSETHRHRHTHTHTQHTYIYIYIYTNLISDWYRYTYEKSSLNPNIFPWVVRSILADSLTSFLQNIWLYIYIYIYIYIYVYIYIYMCVCVCVITMELCWVSKVIVFYEDSKQCKLNLFKYSNKRVTFKFNGCCWAQEVNIFERLFSTYFFFWKFSTHEM